MAYSPDPFFIGWAKKPPKALQGFLAIISVAMLGGFLFAGVFLGAGQADPEGGAFRFDLGEQTLKGTLIAKPYPMIWLEPEHTSSIQSRMIMLNGNGKTGVGGMAGEFDGGLIEAKGVLLERGDLQMLQINRPFKALPIGPGAQPERIDLGRWRLSGEICDGRCYVGGMRPGEGIAHKACANLCINGGQPPVFVTRQAVEGATFMLLGSSDYGPLPPSVLDHTGVPVELEGRLERIGDLILLLVDAQSLRIL